MNKEITQDKTTIEMVKEFQDAFGQQTPDKPTLHPTTTYEGQVLTSTIFQAGCDLTRTAKQLLETAQYGKTIPELRLHLLTEELAELTEAIYHKDIVGILDALTDLQYVLDGTYLAFGFSKDVKQAAFNEVHFSNMSKLGEDGKPILNEAGRVMKGPNYFKPDLKKFL